MNFIPILLSLIFADLGFGATTQINASQSLFPQFMLSQYYLTQSAGEVSQEMLLAGEISVFRYGFRSFPERIVNKFLSESDNPESIRNKIGYSLHEVEEILNNAVSEEDKKTARERVGKTPSEVSALLASKPALKNDERSKFLEDEQRLLKYDPQTEELEIFLIVPYSIDRVEEIYRRFDMWPKFHQSYRESKVLSDSDFETLPEKFKNLKRDNNNWYHFYRSKILQFEWKGVNKFERFEESSNVKRVVLRWDLCELFDGNEDDDFWDDDGETDNPFENDGIDVSSGYVLLEEFVDSTGTRDPSRTIILLKYQFRIKDPTLSDTKEIPESVRLRTMNDFVTIFFENLKREIEK